MSTFWISVGLEVDRAGRGPKERILSFCTKRRPPTPFNIRQLHVIVALSRQHEGNRQCATGYRCAMPPERPSGAAFGCTRSKYLLGLPETSRNRPGSKLITTRRFTQMAGRNSWFYRTLGRGLEQCFPTSKYATCTPSLPWAKSCTLPRPPSD